MVSEQSIEFTKLLASVQERLANPNPDLPVIRNICKALTSATKEPEGVTYVEVYAGDVPALWCIPEGCNNDCVLLHYHASGTVVFSKNSDRQIAGHIAKAAGMSHCY
jgi:hypothetical protein